MSRRSGIEASNVLQGPRKRLRGSNTNNNDNDAAGSVEEPAATSAAAAAGAATASGTAAMGAIERKIHSLSLDQLTQSGQRLMDTVMDAIDPTDGAPLHDFFLQLPDADEYPDYYEIIKRPLALDAIQQKLDQRAYASLPDIKHDFETICNNAKRYNLRDTPVWLKARDLHSLIKITYVQIVESLPEPSAAAPPSTTMPADQPSSSDAQPARSKRILLRSTKSQQKLNDAKSEPQDATAPPPPSSESSVERAQQAADLPSTPARQQSLQPATTVGTPSSQADDDDADADGDDGWDDANSSKLTKGGLLDGRKRPGKRGKRLKATLRQLVHDLRRVVGTRGYPIVAQFDALPKRNEVPEYYQVVQRPICMRDIEHRVYEKSYINAHALFTDLEQMLNNAMSFYPPESTIWQDAHEIRSYFEREAIPALIQDGFTLEKDDVRQSALPLHLAANSTIEAHKAAYKMIVSKASGMDPSASQSPEPSSRIRLGSAGLAGSPALPPATALPASSPAPFGSPSPAPGATMSTPGPMPMSMPMLPPGSMSTSMSPMPTVPGLPTMPGVTGMPIVASPGRPLQYPGTAATPVASPANLSVRPAATPDSVRRPVGRPPGKGTPTRSNPYPFLERRIGPGRPKKHEAAARQAAIAAHEEMQRKLALQQQQEEMAAQQHAAAMANQPLPQWQQQQLAQQQQLQHQLYMQQQAKQQEQQQQRLQQQRQRQQQQKQQQQQQQQEQQQQQQAMLEQQHHYQQQLMQQQQAQHGMPAFSPSVPNQMLPPGAPPTPGQHAAFGAGTMVTEPVSPLKRKEALLPAEPSVPLAYEGLENRTPLIASFAIDMEVETADGQTLAVPSVEVKNASVTQHTLQIPPNASSITIEFPLRMLNRRARAVAPKTEAGEADAAGSDGDVSMADGVNGGHKDAVEEAGKTGGVEVLTWPWQPQLWFNGRPASGKWVAADALIDPALLDEQQKEADEAFTTSLGCSFCRVRLLPKRGINVFEVSVAPEASYEPLKHVSAERYSIYFC